MRLIDRYGREITSLRFSLTRKCNLNCIYCHHEGEFDDNEECHHKDDESGISADLVVRVAKVASQRFSVRKVKFSGGEPLLRRDLPDIIQHIRAYEDDISLTTNGTLLSICAEELADAGLDRVNISIDTLNAEKYDIITRTKGNLSRVIDGIHAAISSNLTPVKLNMVVLDLNKDDIDEMMDFVRGLNAEYGDDSVILQLIELVPFHVAESNSNDAAGLFNKSASGVSSVDFREIEEMLRLNAKAMAIRPLQHRRKYFIDGLTVEVVKPMDNSAFCMHCKRLRITSDGKIKPCLLRNDNLVPLCEDEDCIAERLIYAMKLREPFYCEKNESPPGLSRSHSRPR